jgi:hypothetical protein
MHDVGVRRRDRRLYFGNICYFTAFRSGGMGQKADGAALRCREINSLTILENRRSKNS